MIRIRPQIQTAKNEKVAFFEALEKAHENKQQESTGITAIAGNQLFRLVLVFVKNNLRCFQPGAYLGGGHWAMAPPLGRQDRIIA